MHALQYVNNQILIAENNLEKEDRVKDDFLNGYDHGYMAAMQDMRKRLEHGQNST